MEQALVRFGRFVNDVEGPGRATGTSSWRSSCWTADEDGGEYDQSHLPVVQQYEAVGHAVRASYSYSGMADVAMRDRDADYQSAMMSLWDNLVNRKYYLTGGVGSGETSEGFGPDYSLRNNAYCESCSSCGEIFFQHKMNLAYHDAKYADLYEETLYNALLGSIDLAGKNFYYHQSAQRRRRRVTPWHNCPCCVGNIPRTLLSLPTWTYVKGEMASTSISSSAARSTSRRWRAPTSRWCRRPTTHGAARSRSSSIPATPKQFAIHVRVPDHNVSSLYTSTPEVRGIDRSR